MGLAYLVMFIKRTKGGSKNALFAQTLFMNGPLAEQLPPLKRSMNLSRKSYLILGWDLKFF